MGKIHYIILFNPIQDLVGCIKEGLRMEDSSEAVSKGLRCRALFVFRPKMSSILKRCCQLYTEAVVHPTVYLGRAYGTAAWNRSGIYPQRNNVVLRSVIWSVSF